MYKLGSLKRIGLEDIAFAIIFAIFILLVVLSVFGFITERTIQYEGERYKVSEIEEIIGDELEAENPGYDIDVSISIDDEDDN